MSKYSWNWKKQLNTLATAVENCHASTKGLIIWQWTPSYHRGEPISLTSSNLKISFSSPSIFNVTPFNAFLGENMIPGSRFCSFKYFLQSLEMDLFPISFDQSWFPSQLLIVELRFRKRLSRTFRVPWRKLGVSTFSAFQDDK